MSSLLKKGLEGSRGASCLRIGVLSFFIIAASPVVGCESAFLTPSILKKFPVVSATNFLVRYLLALPLLSNIWSSFVSLALSRVFGGLTNGLAFSCISSLNSLNRFSNSLSGCSLIFFMHFKAMYDLCRVFY